MSPNEEAREILGVFYKSEAVYLTEITTLSLETQSVTGSFLVPMLPSYSVLPIDYVTAEQYVRCLSQLSYVLIGVLIKNGTAQFGSADFDAFVKLMTECKLYFLKTDLSYRKKVLRDTPFELTLTLVKNGRMKKFYTCTLRVEGVVRGELVFCGGE